MCKPVKCPQCGHEFTPERAIKSGAWAPEEDELLLNGCQKDRKTIAELSDELNRSQDATRNRIWQLRILLLFVYIVQHKQNKMIKIVYFANCKKLLFCYNIKCRKTKGRKPMMIGEKGIGVYERL